MRRFVRFVMEGIVALCILGFIACYVWLCILDHVAILYVAIPAAFYIVVMACMGVEKLWYWCHAPEEDDQL